MGDDEVKSTRSRFLSRMQRSKSTKDVSPKDLSRHDESLNKDVVDFLKPSTDRAAFLRPRIDVAIAQRWPEAQHVERPDALPSFETPENVNGMRKRRRREGLAVSFVPTAPEIVGEGGDECPYPTIEISKAKAQGRPALTPQRRSADHSRAWAAQPVDQTRPTEHVNVEQGSPRPLRRANTTHYDQGSGIRQDDQRFAGLGAERNSGSSTPLSQHDRKRSLMTASEGMALRRASSIPNFDDHDDDNNDNEIDDQDDPPPHFGPGSGQKNFSMPLRSPTLPQISPRSPARIIPTQNNDRLDDGVNRARAPPARVTEPSKLEPSRQSPAAVQLDLPERGAAPSRSPFDDPKYNQRRTNGAVAAPRPPPQNAVPTLPQVSLPDSQTAYPGQPSYAGLSRPGLESRSSRDLNSEARDVSSADYTPFRPQRSRSSTLTGPLSPPAIHRQQSVDPASAQPSPISPSTKEAALTDFASRVSYMMRRFELYVQVEAKPQGSIDQSSRAAWLRAAYWWYLNGKMGLEAEVRVRQQSRPSEHHELLLQGHVDLAKAWWIISSQLEGLKSEPDSPLHADYTELQSCIQALCLSLGRNNILPPSAALIQHQDSRIWLGHFSTIKSSYLDSLRDISPSRILPVGDTPTQFYYSRFMVKVSMTSKQGVDESTIPCLLTVVRGVRSYQTEAIIASQDNFISVRIAGAEAQALSWRSVSWVSSRCALSVPLPDSTMLHLRLQDQDYRALGNMVEYSRNAMKTMQPARNEALSYQAQLSTLQYSTTSTTSAFPRGPLKHCRVLMIAARETGMRRLVLATEPAVKILSCVSHQESGPGHMVEEGQMADASSTIELLFRDERKQSQAVLTFRDEADMKKFQAIRKGEQQTSPTAMAGSGAVQPPGDAATIPLTYFDIRSANDISQQHQFAGPSSAFGWKYLALSNDKEEATKLIMRHGYGQFVDQLDYSAGELSIRLPTSVDQPSIEVHRGPQDTFDAALDPKQCPQSVGSMTSIMVQAARQQSTIRTYVFPQLQALHDFQQSATGFAVRFDGIASTLAISRRMMVVPIHHKWTANNVRLQVASNPSGSVVRVLAFMQGFEHADAMCFQVKSTDVFEKIKGDTKHKKWALKLVDAKFSLHKPGKGEEAHISALRRQFISLEGLEYAEEHDDITVGFDSEEARELFGNALPAATTTPKLISLRRRI